MGSAKKARVTAEMRRELQVAAAVAREALLQTHVKQAVHLIGLADNRVSVMRMLGIYVRVNALSDADAELLTTRVLALLGEEAQNGDRPVVYVEGEAGVAEALPLVGIVRDRLRGRALNDLRRWVELHTGRTQVVLLDVHVTHALRFVELLQETHAIPAALRSYAELVAVPKTLTDTLYYFVLDRLAAEGLPGKGGAEEVPFPEQPRTRPMKAASPERRRKGALDGALP